MIVMALIGADPAQRQTPEEQTQKFQTERTTHITQNLLSESDESRVQLIHSFALPVVGHLPLLHAGPLDDGLRRTFFGGRALEDVLLSVLRQD